MGLFKNGVVYSEFSPAGILLRLERLRQKKGQKEVCYGICVVSYLSKIERGMVKPDENLVEQLFARLGIVYEREDAFLAESRSLLDSYIYNLTYGLKNEEVCQKLWQRENRLLWSPLALDTLLVLGMECVFRSAGVSSGKQIPEYVSVLEELKEHMNGRQFSYYCLIRAELEKKPQSGLVYRKRASEGLNNTLGLRSLIYGYCAADEYNEIHRLEQRFTALALEEGNVYALADYYFMNATAYACVNMEEMMTVYYEKVRHLLQNTGWWEETADDWNYNMGATYLELGKYDLALKYLEQVQQEHFLLWHKKARLNLRLGNREAAEELMVKMEKQLAETPQPEEADRLMLKELKMEGEPGFLENPEYLAVLEELFAALRKERNFGFLYQYKEVAMEAFARQRKYKKALEFQKEISLKVQKGVC